MEEEIICNRFEQVLGEWIALHDEELNFKDNTRPQIKLCGLTLRIRANDAWSKLPLDLKECLVAHEIGHREMNHVSVVQDNPFYRLGFVLCGTVDPRELEADRYAIKLIGRSEYVRRLLKYVDTQIQHLSDSGLREIQYRIKALEVSD